MNTHVQATLRNSLHRHMLAGVGATFLLLLGLGGWASTTELSGAVIAPGSLAVEGKAKAVQHPKGGVVAELRVREGQQVRTGEIVIRLDSTVTQANLEAASTNLNQLYAREARLAAERDGLDLVEVPAILHQRLGDRSEGAMTSERRLFGDRRVAREGQKGQLLEQIRQLNEQIAGLDVQRQAKDDEIGLIEKEMLGTRKLFEMGLIPLNRINNLDRSAARLRGERGQLIAQSASTRGRIAEIELKRLDVDQSMRADVAQELRDIQNKQTEMIEKEVSALDELKRVDIIAPVSGLVHDLTVHTIGGVIRGGDELMQIVPSSELSVEARIRPQDIDQVSVGQMATLRLSAFNRNTTPELQGNVTRLSADLETDKQTGATYYRAAVAISESERHRIPDLTLVPGMPVEAAIRTSDRTVVSYLFKPIRDHASRVFRDD